MTYHYCSILLKRGVPTRTIQYPTPLKWLSPQKQVHNGCQYMEILFLISVPQTGVPGLEVIKIINVVLPAISVAFFGGYAKRIATICTVI